MGDSMVTRGPPWADACREFMIVPITANALNTAAAISWFLYRFIFAPLLREQLADLTGRSAALLKIVIKAKTGGWGPEHFLVLRSVMAVTVSRVPSPTPASPLYVRASVVVGI
jgi:hypothetical protein